MLFHRFTGIFAVILLAAGVAHADLDGYMESLRISADANLGEFRAGIAAHFNASGAELDQVFLAVGHPSEAALCFWLARTSGRPVDVVVQHYRVHKKSGWGALAQSLGIKPGSAEFKALKAGQIGWEPPGSHGKTGGADAPKPKGSKDRQGSNAKDHEPKGKGRK